MLNPIWTHWVFEILWKIVWSVNITRQHSVSNCWLTKCRSVNKPITFSVMFPLKQMQPVSWRSTLLTFQSIPEEYLLWPLWVLLPVTQEGKAQWTGGSLEESRDKRTPLWSSSSVCLKTEPRQSRIIHNRNTKFLPFSMTKFGFSYNWCIRIEDFMSLKSRRESACKFPTGIPEL